MSSTSVHCIKGREGRSDISTMVKRMSREKERVENELQSILESMLKLKETSQNPDNAEMLVASRVYGKKNIE